MGTPWQTFPCFRQVSPSSHCSSSPTPGAAGPISNGNGCGSRIPSAHSRLSNQLRLMNATGSTAMIKKYTCFCLHIWLSILHSFFPPFPSSTLEFHSSHWFSCWCWRFKWKMRYRAQMYYVRFCAASSFFSFWSSSNLALILSRWFVRTKKHMWGLITHLVVSPESTNKRMM